MHKIRLAVCLLAIHMAGHAALAETYAVIDSLNVGGTGKWDYPFGLKMSVGVAVLTLGGCVTPVPPTVCFSPGGHCADDVIREVAAAHKSIYVQAYGFTHPGIARSLADAEARGVDVEAILDKGCT